MTKAENQKRRENETVGEWLNRISRKSNWLEDAKKRKEKRNKTP